MERFLSGLLESDIWRDVERRFGHANGSSDGSPGRERG
jgi:hypothetical protein